MTTRKKLYGVLVVAFVLVALFLALFKYQRDQSRQVPAINPTPTTYQPSPAISPAPTIAPESKETVTDEPKSIPRSQRTETKIVASDEASPTPTPNEINFLRQSRGLRRVFFAGEEIRGFLVPPGLMAVEEPVGTQPIDQCSQKFHLQCVIAQGDVQLRLLQCLKSVECELCLSHAKKEIEPDCSEAKWRAIE